MWRGEKCLSIEFRVFEKKGRKVRRVRYFGNFAKFVFTSWEVEVTLRKSELRFAKKISFFLKKKLRIFVYWVCTHSLGTMLKNMAKIWNWSLTLQEKVRVKKNVRVVNVPLVGCHVVNEPKVGCLVVNVLGKSLIGLYSEHSLTFILGAFWL